MLSNRVWLALNITLFALAMGWLIDDRAVRAGAICALGVLAIERWVNWRRHRAALAAEQAQR